jgi:hypothetical protein
MPRTPGPRLLVTALLTLAAAGLPRAHVRTPEVAGPQVQAPESGQAFTLGVLRRDGAIIPYASYSAGRWANHWPAPGQRPDIPITLAGSPKSWWPNGRPAGFWTAWPMRGESRVVHVKGVISLTAECQPQVALLTDYSSLEPLGPRGMQPHPKDGLASTGDVLVEPLEILNAQSADWTRVAADVAAKVTDSETKLLADRRVSPGLSEPERRKKAFTLEALFRSPGARPGTTLLYFEGVKRYGQSPAGRRGYQAGAELLTYAVGFVAIDPQTPPRIVETVALSDDRREGLLYTLPLGSFRAGGKLYWAVQRSGWGYERFDVLEASEADVKTAIETAGGTCR